MKIYFLIFCVVLTTSFLLTDKVVTITENQALEKIFVLEKNLFYLYKKVWNEDITLFEATEALKQEKKIFRELTVLYSCFNDDRQNNKVCPRFYLDTKRKIWEIQSEIQYL